MTESEIIKMIHCDSPKIIQNKGIQLALQKNDLNFIMYYSSDPDYSENCAKIFTSLRYKECAKYFDDLFSWIEDPNCIGADKILEYLTCAPATFLLDSFKRALEAAVKRKNTGMLYSLNLILSKNSELDILLKKDDAAQSLLEKSKLI